MAAWKNTLEKLLRDCAVQDVQSILLDFERAYSEAHRRYHTLKHIDHLLQQLDSAFSAVSVGASPAASAPSKELLLAALYHDVVYDTTRFDNEEQSAFLLGDLLSACDGVSLDISRIQEMIRATKHSGDFEPADEETKLLLDADMSILGTEKASYDDYVRNVRFEYRHVSDELWKYHRVRFLIACLKSTRIFYSSYFSTLEKQARQNIADEALSLL